MTEFQAVKWTEKFGGKWYVSSAMGIAGTHDKKKTAVNKALGEAQQVANKHDVLVITEIYTKKGDYQKSEKTYPV